MQDPIGQNFAKYDYECLEATLEVSYLKGERHTLGNGCSFCHGRICKKQYDSQPEHILSSAYTVGCSIKTLLMN